MTTYPGFNLLVSRVGGKNKNGLPGIYQAMGPLQRLVAQKQQQAIK